MADALKKYYDEYDKQNKSTLNSQIATVQSTLEKNRGIVNENYGAKIKETEQSYDDQHRINAVQKLINEQDVAESMANSGLTNSGLNRTQQTAVQLSYANNRASLDRQRLSAVDALTREMNAYLTEIDTNAQTQIASLKDTYAQNKNSYAQELYKADKEAETQRLKDQQEYNLKLLQQQQTPKNLTKFDYGTALTTAYGANGNVVYTDANGNTATMRAGSNPFTGTFNSDLLNEDGVYDASRAFDNGYQPRYYKGKVLTTYKPSKTSGITNKTEVPWRNDGVEQQIFTTGNDKYYIWYGPGNRYVEAQFDPFKNDWKFNLG